MEREVKNREHSGSGSSGDHLNSSLDSSREELHLRAEEYIEKKVEDLDENELKELDVTVDELVDKSYNCGNIQIGLGKAIRALAEESESILIDVKLLCFLERFYHKLPITSGYTEEVKEENFKTAISYSVELLGIEKMALLNDMYPDYFESEN